uniref:BRCT domain-containing protein n=1 Tax=Ciona savignyi TaxID=51511 RepID=H2ZBQ2_CIOSA
NMPQIKLQHIVSFSSEHKVHKVENLLKGGKWKCGNPGEKQGFVVFQFPKATKISSIDVGNNGSAFVEVLVCRTGGEEKYEVLLVASSLMSPLDSRNEKSTNTVRMFGSDKLSSASDQLWDQVKVVCTQPFNKHIAYGLSFIHFNTPEEEKDTIQESVQKEATQLEIKKLSLKKGEAKKETPSKVLGSKQKIVESGSKQKITSGLKRSAEPKGQSTPSKKQLLETKLKTETKAPSSKNSSDRILNGVVVALSGYQNPLRGQIRETALKMGAQYRKEWKNDCTHLICAFRNTPKYSQVMLAGGKIVKHTWIMECWANKKLLNWKKYSLAPVSSDDEATSDTDASHAVKDAAKEDPSTSKMESIPSKSEEEKDIYDESTDVEDSDDTDTEINAFLASNNKSKVKVENTDDSINGCDVSKLKELPNYFSNVSFYILGDFTPAVKRMLQRHIIAFGGYLQESINDNVKYALTQSSWNKELQNALDHNRSVTFVRPEWVFKCGQAVSLLPCTMYTVMPT